MAHKCTAVFVIIMKYTQKIQNKRTRANAIGHNADTFAAVAVRQFGSDNIEKILEL